MKTIQDMEKCYPKFVVEWQRILANKFAHYCSFVTTKLDKDNVGPISNQEGFRACARLLRGRYAFYFDRQSKWQNNPKSFVPKGLSKQPKIIFEFFDKDVAPIVGSWSTLQACEVMHIH